MDDEPGAFRPWVEARLLAEAGFEVTVITSAVQYMTGTMIGSGSGWCRDEIRDGIRILRVWTITDYRRSIARRILNYLIFALLAALAALIKVRSRVHSIFAATDPIFFMPFLLIVSAIKRAPIILDERDLFPDTAIAVGIVKEGWLTWLVFTMQQFLRHRAISLLAATPGIRRRLIGYGHDPARIHVLLNADPYLSLSQMPPVPQKVAQYRLQFSSLACYAGGFGHVNDVGTIIRAAAELRLRDDLGFLIVGGGERLDEYVNLARELDVRNIEFLGALPRTTTRAILAQCDVCLQALPSDPFFGGTLTSKTFDYFGVGAAVVFAGEGDTADLLRESGAGIVVPAQNAKEMAAAVVQLVEDNALRNRMARAAITWFTSHITLPNCLRIIQVAIPHPQSHSPIVTPQPESLG